MRATPAASEVTTGLFVLLAIQLLTSLGAIALLGRISPAVEHIRRENVFSVEAVEEMLEALARRGQPGTTPAELQRHFERALERAQGNITEEEERVPLATLAREGKAAFEGNEAAQVRVVDALRTLSHINRAAAEEVDYEVKRLGTAGAWAATFVGAFAFIFGILVLRRGQRRLLDPLDETVAVIHAWQSGDHHRRCTPERWGQEWRMLMSAVNRLLDERDVLARGDAPAGKGADYERLARALIERVPEPTVVIDTSGEIQVANAPALAVLESDGDTGLRERLRSMGRTGRAAEVGASPVPGTDWVVCLLPK